MAFIPSFHNEGWGFLMVLLDIKKYNRELTFRSFSSRKIGTPRFLPLYLCILILTIGKKNRSKSTPYYIAGSTRNWILAFLFFLVTFYFSLVTASNAEAPKRIISLAPSTTEILFAAGLGDRIVGVTTFCDYPEEAKKKPKIGGMSNPSLEAVVRLKPDIVVMTTDGNPREFEQKLRSMKIKTLVFESLTLAELPDGIRKMGIALDAKERFDILASEIELTINKFRLRRQEAGVRSQKSSINNSSPATTRLGSPKSRHSSPKKVLFIIWPEPLIVAGPRTAINDAINLLGGINIAENAKGRYPKYSLEEIFRQSPDIIFIGKGHKDMEKLSSGLLKRLSNVPAVKNKKVFYVTDSLYRHGPRVIKGIEELAGYLDEKQVESNE